jgi:hypothetical protein
MVATETVVSAKLAFSFHGLLEDKVAAHAGGSLSGCITQYIAQDFKRFNSAIELLECIAEYSAIYATTRRNLQMRDNFWLTVVYGAI